MVLTKRERYIAIGVGVAVAVLVLDQYLISPFLSRQRDISEKTDKVTEDLANGRDITDKQLKLKRVWADMTSGGLKTARGEAESQAQNAVREWCQDCGVTITALSSSRVTGEGKFEVISFHVTGSARMKDVVKLTINLELSPVPLRIADIQLTPHKEGKDDLRVEMTVSTIYETEPARPAVSLADFGGRR